MTLKDDFEFIMFAGWCERECCDYDEIKFKQIQEQFLEDQKDAIKYRMYLEHCEFKIEDIIKDANIVKGLKNFQSLDMRFMIAASSGDKHVVDIYNKIHRILEGKKWN